MMRLCLLILWVVLISGDVWAAGGSVVFDTDETQISVSSDFQGQELVVFGSKPGDGELLIVVEGPKRGAIVRQKSRVFGAWINRATQQLDGVPLFLEYAVSEKIADDYNLQRLLYDDLPEGQEIGVFREALLRLKKRDNLFSETPERVRFYEDAGLFRANFVIPSNVPVGDYMVFIDYFEGNKIVRTERQFKVEQVGLNANLRGLSLDFSFLYGVSCVLMALFAGWVSDKLRKRQ